LNRKVEERRKAISFFLRGSKRLQILCAQTAFAAAKKTLIPTGGRVELQDVVNQHSARGDED
jgi:hypothetical protein